MNEDEPLLKPFGIQTGLEGLADSADEIPVDQRLLDQFLDGSLDDQTRDFIGYLLAHQPSWHNAYVARVLGEPKNRRQSALPSLTWRWGAFAALAASLVVMAWLAWGQPRGDSLRDGPYEVAWARGELTGLERFGAQWQASALEVIQGESKAPENLAGLRGSVDQVRSGRERSPVIAEPYLSLVRATRPTLRWRPVEGVRSYQVTVYRAGGDQVVGPIEVTGTAWTLDRDLERGTVYEWEVAWTRGEAERYAPRRDQLPALFAVVDGQTLSRIEKGEAQVKDSRLLRMTLYLQEGLIEEAAQELAALRSVNEDSRLVERLKETLKRVRQGVGE